MVSVKYLTAEEVENLHEQIILRYGGVFGMISRDLLESACARPKAAVGEQELYPTLVEKAAALMHSLIVNHPFVDGNKRTAFLATQEFLRLNGHQIVADDEEILELTLSIAKGQLSFPEVVQWMGKHVQPKGGN